ncbi:hypothetical protein LZ554_002806 [Drepanopeziza brunnea f. sp. 'monogermtubi']|nr:hypothetical protein LZ554_002806 [Drepanopeziza brunnea f. sp. 'monogermtubi']
MPYTPNNTGFYDGQPGYYDDQPGYYDGQPGYYGATSSEGALRDNAMANNTQQITLDATRRPKHLLSARLRRRYQLGSNQPSLAPQGPENLFPDTNHSEYTEAPRLRLHYPCCSCPKKFETPDLREIHISISRIASASRTSRAGTAARSSSKGRATAGMSGIRIYQGPEERKVVQVTCEHCDEFFASKESYHKHIRNRICQRGFTCGHCSEVFKEKQSRDKHFADNICQRREVVPPLYSRPVESCPMVFDTSEENQEHHWNTHVSS